MSSSGLPERISPAKIGQTIFIGIAWGGVVTSVLFFAFRILVRIKVFGRLHADDGLVLFAWILLLINTILWQLYLPSADFPHRTEQYLRRSIVLIVFFYTGLWSIKLSFLVFFKRLGHNVRHQDIVWWVVLAITVASYVSCLGTIEYRCLASSFLYIETHCALAPGPIKFQRLTLRANMINDVVTDALIILIPVSLLWKVRISIRKKLALGGIFSITVIIMVFAIIRVVVVSSYSQEPDETWLYMWSSIEQAISIIVACLASFPSLFKKSERNRHQRLPGGKHESPSDTTSHRAFFFRKKSKWSKARTHEIDMDNLDQKQGPAVIHRDTDPSAPWDHYQKSLSGSSEHILPLNKAHIGV